MSKKFTVVKFGNDTVEFVPTKWIVAGRMCLWPTNKPNSKILEMVKELCEPEADWDICPCECMASFNSFKKAKKNARDAEYTSHLESESSEGEDTGAVNASQPRKRIRLPSPSRDMESAPSSPVNASQPTKSMRLPSPPRNMESASSSPVSQPSSSGSRQDALSLGHSSRTSTSGRSNSAIHTEALDAEGNLTRSRAHQLLSSS
ncbi:uncharacterized protein LOC135387093 [Ornithodoros turicata]|uniref:uncharacterized protein LOC135387093 n=1 Tax=Ornithodoros turicata TaxID=34597 RepID=UPI00313962B0